MTKKLIWGHRHVGDVRAASAYAAVIVVLALPAIVPSGAGDPPPTLPEYELPGGACLCYWTAIVDTKDPKSTVYTSHGQYGVVMETVVPGPMGTNRYYGLDTRQIPDPVTAIECVQAVLVGVVEHSIEPQDAPYALYGCVEPFL